MEIPWYFLSESTQNQIIENRKRSAERRMKNCIPWDPKMKFQEELNIQADTYKPPILFDVEPKGIIGNRKVFEWSKKYVAESPSGEFRYINNILPKGNTLAIAQNKKEGSVIFDGDVIIPTLYSKEMCRYDLDPWMSLTPLEMFTMRGGIRRSKGRTIIAGLGLGYQLVEVAKRKKVKEIVLVEINKELVEWILPTLEDKYPILKEKVVEVIVGDARDELMKLHGDIALIDIFKGYGGNWFWNQNKCKGIDAFWIWGSSER